MKLLDICLEVLLGFFPWHFKCCFYHRIQRVQGSRDVVASSANVLLGLLLLLLLLLLCNVTIHKITYLANGLTVRHIIFLGETNALKKFAQPSPSKLLTVVRRVASLLYESGRLLPCLLCDHLQALVEALEKRAQSVKALRGKGGGRAAPSLFDASSHMRRRHLKRDYLCAACVEVVCLVKDHNRALN